MSTFLTTLLIVIAVLAVLFIVGVLWLRAKARKAIARMATVALAYSLQSLKEHQAKPENAEDTTLADLITRFEAAQKEADAAYDRGEYEAAVQIAEPLMKEFGAYKQTIVTETTATPTPPPAIEGNSTNQQ
jgi:hypothetical protein